MAQATSISLGKLTTAVQAAVKAAVQKHPKFKIEPPTQLAISYVIRGIPVPETIVANVTLGETRAFAADIASHLSSSVPEGLALEHGRALEPAIYSLGNHLILGIPAPPEVLLER